MNKQNIYSPLQNAAVLLRCAAGFFVEIRDGLVQFGGMSENTRPDKWMLLTAEEILQTIYGDDLKGCSIRPETIAIIVSEAMKQRDLHSRELLGLYGKVVEAVHVLSTPPDGVQVTSPGTLQSLLSDRLDKILAIARKTMETTAAFQAQSNSL